MNFKANFRQQHKEYALREQGLYYGETLISYCNVILVRVIECHHLVQERKIFKYYVKPVFPDGANGETVELMSLTKLSLFELWRCPDVSQTGKENGLLTRKLQLEAALMEPEKQVFLPAGFHKYNGRPIYILGDKVIGAEKLGVDIAFEPVHPYSALDTGKPEKRQNLVREAIMLLPGISEALFYYALQAVIKPILHGIGIQTDYILAVVGPSGHLKTSLSKKFCLWLQDKTKQQTSFSSKRTTKRILEDMGQFPGLNYLVDDFHSYEKTQDIDRQNKRLDDIVRHLENYPDCANVLITGELIKGIFSCIDRMLVLNIPKMSAEALLNNMETVEEDCRNFYQENCVNSASGDVDSTRTYRHCVFLRLTEFLYREYMCGGSGALSCKERLNKALESQYRIQQGLVDIQRIVRSLKDEGILNVSTDSFTKKFKGRRHYLISLSYLKMYQGYKDMQDGKDWERISF